MPVPKLQKGYGNEMKKYYQIQAEPKCRKENIVEGVCYCISTYQAGICGTWNI